MKKLGFKCMAIIAFTLMACVFQNSFANNIRITAKPELINRNTTEHSVFISFPLVWNNSWRSNTPENWDAAWVFAKYREGGGDWNHVYIDTLHSVHRAKANVNVITKVGTSNVSFIKDGIDYVQKKGVGIFVYRADNGKDSVKLDTLAMKWKYAAQDLDDDAVISIRVFAIEMVYVPQAPVEFGDRTMNTNGTVNAGRTIMTMGGTGDIWITEPYNRPGVAISIFAHLGQIAYPNGAVGTMNAFPAWGASTWGLDLSSTGTMMYRNSITYAMGVLVGTTQIATTATSYTPKAWRQYIIKMPAPYKANAAYFSNAAHNTTATYVNEFASRYMVLGSNDSIRWDTLCHRDVNEAIPQSTEHPIALDPAKTKAFTYYKFAFAPSTAYATATNRAQLLSFKLCDETAVGEPENTYYYDRTYRGTMPLRFFGLGVTQAATANFVQKEPLISSMSYPNGYEAFYMMKYELSQHGFCDFMNTLSEPQQRTRSTATSNPTTASAGGPYYTGAYRNYVILKVANAGQPGTYSCLQNASAGRDVNDYEVQGGNIAMNWMNWSDNAAYLCWAGLRPLTELEYEKACKGPAKANNVPVPGMYAWGTANAIAHTGFLTADQYTKKEMALPANANFICQVPDIYPARVGCLATQTSTRSDAGAGYYGAMNLSDNVAELYINCETPEGLAFNGEHGSGMLNGNGDAVITTWPNASFATSAGQGVGTGLRGCRGNSAVYISNATVANRIYMLGTYVGTARYNYLGCRGGRTAPTN